MAYENIRFPKAHFVVSEGYFYYIDEVSNILYKKVADGGVAFTYPLTVPIGSNVVKCMAFDGYFFWTLQDGATSSDAVIKKWSIDNFKCKFVDAFYFTNNSSHKYSITTFDVEHYITALSDDVIGPMIGYCGEAAVSLDDYADVVEYGTVLTIGPNKDGKSEQVTVTGTIGDGVVGLDFYTKYSYESGAPVYFTKDLWMVNRYANTTLSGALYNVSTVTKDINYLIKDKDYLNITAMCFYDDGVDEYLLFAIGTTLRFMDLKTRTVVKSMVLDNIKANMSTIIPINALQIDGDNVYRLQNSATYYQIDNTYISYNYQLSPIRSFIDSVSMDCRPKILPCNGINVSEIKAVVKDQYALPKTLSYVEFQDNDPTGYITTRGVYTALDGTALSYYKAGLVPNNVLIMAKATQFD